MKRISTLPSTSYGDIILFNMQKQKKLFNESQYALPGLTCTSAVWNKVLFCDLTHQTESVGFMTDYDATAAFDRVLHEISVITCRMVGLPVSAYLFIFHLLQRMEFHIITGFGSSNISFCNNSDPLQIGQGILQGSSSAAPIYNICADVSLATYMRIAHGASFHHE